MNKKAITLLFIFLLSSCNAPKKNTDTSKDEKIKTLTIYASNDFHGQIINENGCLGLEKFITFFKEKGEEPNTLLLDQGDSWQGSIYSNINYGNLVNDAMCIAKFDARTIGNHDFDWGIDKLIANTKRSYNGYTIPVLGANIYDYDFENKKEGDIFQSDIAQKSVTYTLENGLKVGIVGTIGKSQITTISSNYVLDICFKDHIQVIKEESTKLRDEGCDIIIATCHSGQENVMNHNLDEYVDLVLCGHTHRVQHGNEHNLDYYQFGRNGENFGKIEIEYDYENKEVLSVDGETLNYSLLNNLITEIDPETHNLVQSYNAKCEAEANVVLANNITRSFDRYSTLPNLMCKAIFDEAKKVDDEVILSYCNDARDYLYSKAWTYADIYDAFPFDNEVFIIEASADEIMNQVSRFNHTYISPSFNRTIESNKKYKIAVIDYLMYHTNQERDYDYFKDNKGNYIAKLDDNYRVILKNYLVNNGFNSGTPLSPNDYSTEDYNPVFNRI